MSAARADVLVNLEDGELSLQVALAGVPLEDPDGRFEGVVAQEVVPWGRCRGTDRSLRACTYCRQGLEVMMLEGAGDSVDWPLVVEGDHRAFARVFDRHSDLVYRFARRRTGDSSLAEDVTAQVFLEAWRQRRRVSLLDGSLRSWLLGVAGNLVRRHWRTVSRRDRAVARLPYPKGLDHAEEVVGRVDDEARLRGLHARLAALPPHQREVLLLWAWEGLAYDEIGSALSIPVGTVRSRLARARARLGDRDGTEPVDREYRQHKATGGDVSMSDERSEP